MQQGFFPWPWQKNRLPRTVQEGADRRAPLKPETDGPVVPTDQSVAGNIIKGNRYIYGVCPAVPSWPPGSVWLDMGHRRYRTSYQKAHVEAAPTPGPERLSLHTIPKVLES